MQQRRSGHYAGENAFDHVHSDMRIDEGHRAVGEDEADIEANQRAASSEHEPHEPADVAVFLDAVAIVDPHERQILYVMKHLEQGDSDEDVRDEIVAVPP